MAVRIGRSRKDARPAGSGCLGTGSAVPRRVYGIRPSGPRHSRRRWTCGVPVGSGLPTRFTYAPLPTTFTNPSPETKTVARRVSISAAMRFFHWELEFPDVFRRSRAPGSMRVLGNPPWDIAKPKSARVFFQHRSAYTEPMETRKRSESRLPTLATHRFGRRHQNEDWLDYNARFRSQSNYVKHAARPVRGPIDSKTRASDRFLDCARHRERPFFTTSWRRDSQQRHSMGFADTRSSFSARQGAADLNLYKLFLDASPTPCSRLRVELGFIVPSGLYSDLWYRRALRDLVSGATARGSGSLASRTATEVFPTHSGRHLLPNSSYRKGGSTGAIRIPRSSVTDLDDWSTGPKSHCDTLLPVPRSNAVQSQRVATLLGRSVANDDVEGPRENVLQLVSLLGDGGPNGWGVRVHNTNFI